MANLKEVRVRIASIKSTRQITSAMKMVSASKLRKGQNAILNLRPYEQQLRQILANINKGLKEEDRNILCLPKPAQKVVVIVVAANKGLCGTFSSNLVKRAIVHLQELREKGLEPKLWLIGRKAEDYFRKSTFVIEECFHELIDNVTVEDAFDFARKAMKVVETGKYDRVDVVYNQFVNAARYELIAEQVLPMTLSVAPVPPHKAEDENGSEYILEPSRKIILEGLVPKAIQTYFYRILLDSFVSEQGARMTAMHQATDNATELLKNLTVTYNKVRQASITNEIVEIVGGAEALNS